MTTERLNAFTDGVIAIIITIMVLELRPPKEAGLAGLLSAAPLFAAYLLSFVNVGIYWNNHHHMLHLTRRVSGAVLWANLILLFWLSLVPFTIRWIDEQGITTGPVAAYGVVLTMAAISFSFLESRIIAADPASPLREALSDGRKEKLSLALYLAAVGAAFLNPWISVALYVAVAAMWLIPDRRIEQIVVRHQQSAAKEPPR